MTRTCTILLAQGDHDTLETVSNDLQRSGHVVQRAPDLLTLSSWVERASFDLLVLEERLPEVTGHGLVPFLKEGLGVRVPIVLWSDMEPTKLDRLALSCGADGALSRRRGAPSLLEYVGQFLGRHSGTPLS